MQKLFLKEEITFADLFAGGGGVTTGALAIPGIKVTWALNHSKTAIECHAKNHPETKHYQADIRTQNVTELEPVDIWENRSWFPVERLYGNFIIKSTFIKKDGSTSKPKSSHVSMIFSYCPFCGKPYPKSKITQ